MMRKKKERIDDDIIAIAKKMLSMKNKGMKLAAKNVEDRVEIVMEWKDSKMEEEYNTLMKEMNELVNWKTNRGTGQRTSRKGHKCKD